MGGITRIALVVAAAAIVLAASPAVAQTQARQTQSPVVLLREARDARVRAQAATAIGSRTDPTMIRHLIRALNVDLEPAVRAACATALANFHTSQARAALRRAQTDPSSVVRSAAATALGSASRSRHCAEIGIYPVDAFEHYYDLCDGALVRRSRPWPVR